MIRRRNYFYYVSTFLAGFFLLGLLACSSNGKKWNHEDYTVKSGDTIYSIAWRYELDPEAFAAWNGLRSPSFIKAGQRLHTRKPYNFDSAKEEKTARDIAYAPASSSQVISSNQKWVKAGKGDTLFGISKRSGVSVDRLAQLNQLKKPYLIKPGQTIFLKPLPTSASTTTKPSHTSAANTKSPATSQAYNWPKSVRWTKPANGKIVKKFSRNRNDSKGIDIAGKVGSRIVASAAGKVVYSGNGLISYGNLIIIKHNKTYLSAYAYNRKLLVKEGDKVKAGQKIAEMGRKDKTSPRLHFEIRKNGKPVDPLKYLPW